MTYEVKGRLSLKILFNDKEFLFNRVNSLGFVHMSASSRMAVPMLHMKLQDNSGFFNDGKLLDDGARIQVIVTGSHATRADNYVFRMNSFRLSPNAGGQQYEFDGYLDTIPYWHASTTRGFTGTSAAALRKLASDCGLDFIGEETTDGQLWLPRNNLNHEWARAIAERGYRSDSSCMQLGLNLDRTLSYVDVSIFERVTAAFSFGVQKSEHFLASDVKPATQSGAMNHFSGYQDAVVTQSSTSDETWVEVKDLAVNKDRLETGSIQLNRQVKKNIEQSSIRFSPIDVGNVHDRYEQALYQNRRGNNLFSTSLELVTPDRTGLRLFDVVHLTVDQPDSYARASSGAYRVGGKTIYVAGADYYEKFTLLRRTQNVVQESSIG